MEKKAYALVQVIKDFRVFILHSHIITYVPNNVVKDIWTQPEPNGNRGKWIAVLLEYDMEIKPTKLMKGQGLARLMDESNCDVLGLNFISDNIGVEEAKTSKEIKAKFLS